MSKQQACIKTTCPYCGVGCGVAARLENDRVVSVSGLQDHPANAGRLCVKGSALHETLAAESRLLYPQVEGQRVDWDTALDRTASGLRTVIEQHGPQAVAFYLSGQLLTEDYYVANKLLKGFIGSSNLDTNSRLCMASAVVGYKRAFGADAVPCSYQDLELCDLLVLVGSNAAWTHPVLYQRMQAAKRKRPAMRIVVIDPRKTASCDIADLHLQLRPGSDAFLFNGLLNFIAANDAIHTGFVEQHCEGLAACLEACADCDLQTVAQRCELPLDDLIGFYRLFTETRKVISFYSQGINQSATGSDKCSAIINCHLAMKKLGQPGMGPFSITGQPNAMGGREVGGLANQLAAHMDYRAEDVDRVSRFWNSANVARQEGYKAVDMFNAIERGEIKAIWIMATNPAVSLPDATFVKRALQQCELVIVSDCVARTDTNAFADILLPACGWGEKDGTVSNSERTISRQRALLPASGEARPDWQIISAVAGRLGYGHAFAYSSARDIFVEHARLSGFENAGSRAFDISALSELSLAGYEELEPIQWPVNKTFPKGCKRLFEDMHFYTPSAKARFFAVNAKLPEPGQTQRFPYVLNTGRLRDQWHTMTRTGLAARLGKHTRAPYAAVSPWLGQVLEVQEGSLVELASHYGKIVLPVRFDAGLRKKEVFVPIHWSDQYAANAKVSVLIGKCTDQYSGQPESKYEVVNVKPVAVERWGLILTALDFIPSIGLYWHKRKLEQGYEYLLALNADGDFIATAYMQKLFPAATLLEFHDDMKNDSRLLCLDSNGSLQAALFIQAGLQNLPADSWRETLLGRDAEGISWQLLSGTDISLQETGNIICSCFGVGELQIAQAIEGGANSIEILGRQLKCGTNCGSCIPELKQLMAAHGLAKPA